MWVCLLFIAGTNGDWSSFLILLQATSFPLETVDFLFFVSAKDKSINKSIHKMHSSYIYYVYRPRENTSLVRLVCTGTPRRIFISQKPNNKFLANILAFFQLTRIFSEFHNIQLSRVTELAYSDSKENMVLSAWILNLKIFWPNFCPIF